MWWFWLHQLVVCIGPDRQRLQVAACSVGGVTHPLVNPTHALTLPVSPQVWRGFAARQDYPNEPESFNLRLFADKTCKMHHGDQGVKTTFRITSEWRRLAVVACGGAMQWQHVVVCSGGMRWWHHVVVACSGGMWWHHVAACSGTVRWWWRRVTACGGVLVAWHGGVRRVPVCTPSRRVRQGSPTLRKKVSCEIIQ